MPSAPVSGHIEDADDHQDKINEYHFRINKETVVSFWRNDERIRTEFSIVLVLIQSFAAMADHTAGARRNRLIAVANDRV